MAHLVFVHGINNQMHYPSDIENLWWQNILEGWRKHGFGREPRKPRITVAYYAQRLYAAGAGKPFLTDDPKGELPPLDLGTLVAMGTEAFDSSGGGIGFLQDFAARYGVVLPAEEIQKQGLVRRGLIELGDFLESVLPDNFSKNAARRFLGQAALYCDDAGLRRGIERQVMALIARVTDPLAPIPRLGDEPIVLVTHSLGTVVGYRMLFTPAARAARIPLFITLGTPLTHRFIQRSIDQPRLSYPRAHVHKWINAGSDEDFVTLGDLLTPAHMGFDGIENHRTTEYLPGDGYHDIGPHLRTRPVSRALHQVLS